MISSSLIAEREYPRSPVKESQTLKPVRVLLIEPLVSVRAGLKVLLENQPFLSVLGAVGNRQEALAIAAEQKPELALIDMDMLYSGESHFIADLLHVADRCKVLVLASEKDDAAFQRAVKDGAIGIVLKEQIANVLLSAIERVNAGQVWSVLSQLSTPKRYDPPNPDEARIALLTEREREVINLVGLALKNKEIADRLFISEATVRHHLTSIFAKLNVDSRLGLVVYGYRHGIIKISYPRQGI
ncbi:MAG TPA: response regulator transcription factor [Blastocatellia bacterium]|nr:response regulator transcription factor [Blastocatellia bacterium]